MQNSQLSEFGLIFLFILGGIAFVSMGLLVASLLRPNRPNKEKLTPYECGEDALGNAWGQFHVKYYVIALIFILFEVEIIFLFPWATVFGQEKLIEVTEGRWGWFALIEVFVFIGLLIIGLAYVWAKGYLDWMKPKEKSITYQSKIPKNLYDQINKKQSTIRSN